MKHYDVVIIGAGLLGCFAARNLMRYKLSAAVIERHCDVCMEISRANTAVVYGSQDNKPGTVKAQLCKRACDNFDSLCAELGVDFNRCGSLMVCFGENGLKKLERGLKRGKANGVEGLRIINRDETLNLEPYLSEKIYKALYAENTGTVNPWQLCIAAAENAAANGAEFFFNQNVLSIFQENGKYRVISDREEYTCSCVVNCGGLEGDKINSMVGVNTVRIVPSRADYYILDEKFSHITSRVIFQENEEKSKGITAVPTVEGNLMLGPSEEPTDGRYFDTEKTGMTFVEQMSEMLFPTVNLDGTIRTFASTRPNPFYTVEDGNGGFEVSGQSIKDFAFFIPDGHPGYISFAGIKTPGMTCADELGRIAAEHCARQLKTGENPDFNPVVEKHIKFRDVDGKFRDKLIKNDKKWGNIVCSCKKVTEAEIVRAIHADPPALTVDGVKRRTGCTLGRCQGSRCTERIISILAREMGVNPGQICKDDGGSWIVK